MRRPKRSSTFAGYWLLTFEITPYLIMEGYSVLSLSLRVYLVLGEQRLIAFTPSEVQDDDGDAESSYLNSSFLIVEAVS